MRALCVYYPEQVGHVLWILVFQLKEMLENDEDHSEQLPRITVADVEAAAKHAGLTAELTAAICTFWREHANTSADSIAQQQQLHQQFLNSNEQSAAVAATYLKLQRDWREPALFVNARRLPAATSTTAGDGEAAKYALAPSLQTADHIALLVSVQQKLGQQVLDWLHSELATTDGTTDSTTDSTTASSGSGSADAVSDAVLQLVTSLQAHYAEKRMPIEYQIQQLTTAYNEFRSSMGQRLGQPVATITAAQLTSGQSSLLLSSRVCKLWHTSVLVSSSILIIALAQQLC
jgi:hypothetical protein